ncbi:MAG TPA: hypothetical protein VEL07_06625 [Planctomycetota bacterium]|nr:hypothetical protein [Planctomycetota bacterium]
MTADAGLTAWHWQPQPQAERLVQELIGGVVARCAPARELAGRMRRESGTRFADWVDHVVVPGSVALEADLRAAGFALCEDVSGAYWSNGDGLFPDVLLRDASVVAIAVESVADVAAALDVAPRIEGDPLARMRRARLGVGDGGELWAIERHGHVGFAPPVGSVGLPYVRHLDAFRTRPRALGFAPTRALIEAAVRDVGRDTACDLFFAAERDYWQRRNRAARVQKARQDRLGLGWANHDHHTYRSSRGAFRDLIACLELLGMHCRERFYAGGEAGWGAQVLEQSATGVVVFADVDMTPEELAGDFAHDGLPDREELGTVGLWCALHGEAFLEAGMHHLEATFAYDDARAQLAEAGVASMPPFTDYPWLHQCFTEGERWAVDGGRIGTLLADRRITPTQAEQFRSQGAIGSHLEILERNQGFKGFNQKGVSEIIARTDPRRQAR